MGLTFIRMKDYDGYTYTYGCDSPCHDGFDNKTIAEVLDIGSESDTSIVFKNVIEVYPGMTLTALCSDDNVVVYSTSECEYREYFELRRRNLGQIIDADPFITVNSVKVLDGTSRTYQKMVSRNDYPRSESLTNFVDTYDGRKDYWHDSIEYDKWETSVYRPWYNNQYTYYSYKKDMEPVFAERNIPWIYATVELAFGDIVKTAQFRFKRPTTGRIDQSFVSDSKVSIKLDIFGKEESIQMTLESWYAAYRVLKAVQMDDQSFVWNVFLSQYNGKSVSDVNQESLKALESKKDIKAVLDKLKTDNNLLFRYYLWLHDGKTREGTSNNRLIASMLKAYGNNYELFSGVLLHSLLLANGTTEPSSYRYDKSIHEAREICLKLPGADEAERIRREKKEWNLRKDLSGQADGLGIDHDKYPLLFNAVANHDINVGIFHEPGDPLKLVNVEFALWERALSREGWAEVLYRIANDAAKRSTYTRKITPYIAFLFRMEKYMHNITGNLNWRSMPTYVESQWQLEMTEEAGQQTSKRRSAFTPVADNVNRVLTIPYAAMSISGRQTTYCYSEEYHVFEENMYDEEGGGIVQNTMEEKLNGKDDYGLMYFTLTGTSRNQGYPTFLIIRENRRNGPFIHFHRVHPCRYKEGRATPSSRLVEECYRYMAGNVRAEEITCQQGDLIFIKADKVGDAVNEPKLVTGYENHTFMKPISGNTKPRPPYMNESITMYESTSKSIKNRLGFIEAPNGLTVRHPEHDWITMPAGTYEIRRCKSWEANPISVWTLTID